MVDKPKSAGAKPAANPTTRRTSNERIKLAAGLRGAPRTNSVDKAADVFANFSLSRFGKSAVPANYIDRRKANVKDPGTVLSVQKALIKKQLSDVSPIDARNRGMTLAFRKSDLEGIAKSLPGLQANGGKIELDDLLEFLRARMKGTNVFANGNPVARRLTTEDQFRSQAQAIIDRISGTRGPKS